MADKKTPLGTMIDQLEGIRAKKRKAQVTVDELDEQYKALDALIQARLQEEGMGKASGKKATASLSSTVVANVIDWDKLFAYVKKTGYFHLFQRRISDPAFRELAEKKAVPGIEPFTKLTLSLTTLKP